MYGAGNPGFWLSTCSRVLGLGSADWVLEMDCQNRAMVPVLEECVALEHVSPDVVARCSSHAQRKWVQW